MKYTKTITLIICYLSIIMKVLLIIIQTGKYLLTNLLINQGKQRSKVNLKILHNNIMINLLDILSVQLLFDPLLGR